MTLFGTMHFFLRETIGFFAKKNKIKIVAWGGLFILVLNTWLADIQAVKP